jgi:hypothetical protein
LHKQRRQTVGSEVIKSTPTSCFDTRSATMRASTLVVLVLVACCLLALATGIGAHATSTHKRKNYPGFLESHRAVNNEKAAAALHARGGRPFGDAPTHGPVSHCISNLLGWLFQ